MAAEAEEAVEPEARETTQPRIQARALMLSVVEETAATPTPPVEVPLTGKLQQLQPAAAAAGQGTLVPPNEWAERVLLGKLS